MPATLALSLKDLRLLWRDRFGMFWVLAFPLLQALFFGSIFSGEGRGAGKMGVAIVDEDGSEGSRAFVERLTKSDALTVETLGREQAADGVRRGKRVAYVVLRKGFGEAARSFWSRAPELEVGIDPSRRAESGYLQGLLMEAIYADLQRTFSDPRLMRERVAEWRADLDGDDDLPVGQRRVLGMFFAALDSFLGSIDFDVYKQGAGLAAPKIEAVAVARRGDHPRSSYEITFPSAMLWGVIGCTAAFALSLVIERKSGTLLRLRVAPLSRRQILGAKALACLLACAGVIVFLLVLGRVSFGVRITAPGKLALAIVSTAVCFVGLTMTFSVIGRSEQGVAGASWASLLIFAMLGGGMVPLIAMPEWMLRASHVSPVKWGIYALEGAIWRGFSYDEMLLPCGILVAIGGATFLTGVALLRRVEA